MDVEMPKAGAYVVAVSGGVDSMALLHLLNEERQGHPAWKLTVAHMDHGMRPDSAEDRRLVQAVAKNYGLPFAYREARLGAGASEAAARKVRYEFLREVQLARGAGALITAHHQDDVLETAIINMLRGTGRKGLTALASRPDVVRPLMNVPKSEILQYSKKHRLQWREDSTNKDESYFRNYVRLKVLPQFSQTDRQRLLTTISAQRHANIAIDELLGELLKSHEKQLERLWFNALEHKMALEVMATWLRTNGVRDFDRKGLERLVVAAKVGQPGKLIDILGNTKLQVGKQQLALVRLER